MKTSVIIAFYNNIHFLEMVLYGFERQSDREFDIIIADDGSSKENVHFIKNFMKQSSLKIHHVWHEDDGWQKNKILNKVIMFTDSEYLIFIDQDCIPHVHFVKEHRKNANVKWALAGRRVNLSEEFSKSITKDFILSGKLDFKPFFWIWQGLRRKMNHTEKALYLPWLKWLLFHRKKSILGCNFSVHKENLLAVNGFDERYKMPTFGEDSDIDFRMGLLGVKDKYIGSLAIQYHFYHKLLSRESINKQMFADVVASKVMVTPYGIKKL